MKKEKIKPFPKHKLYYFEWIDTIHDGSSWSSEQDVKKFAVDSSGRVKQVGWLLLQTDDYFVIANSIVDLGKGNYDYGGLEKIPKAWIKNKKLLKI